MLIVLVTTLIVALVECQRQDASCATFDGGINMCSYEPHAVMVGKLQNLAKRYPSLAQVGSIGTSARGKHLAFIKITSNVTAR